MRKTLLLSALLVGTLLVCLVGAEVLLRLLRLYEPPPYPPQARNPTMYRAHEVVGYNLWPSARMSYRYPLDNPHLRTVVSNSDGFRNAHDFDAPHAGPRILVTGDSFVFGEGVDGAERITEQLGKHFERHRIDNLGMTGWGVDLMLRATRWVLPRTKPELLVVCIYTDDFRRVGPYYSGMGYAVPRFVLQQGQLASIPYPRPSFVERMRLNQARMQLGFKYSNTVYRLHEALLDEFRTLVEQHGSKLAFVFFPGRDDTPTDRERRGWLADYGERSGVPVLDLTEPIHSAGVERTYIERNWHWNAEGHRLAAEQLAGFVNDRQLIQAVRPEAAAPVPPAGPAGEEPSPGADASVAAP